MGLWLVKICDLIAKHMKIFVFFFFGKWPRYVSIYSGIIPNILHSWNKQECVWHHVFVKRLQRHFNCNFSYSKTQHRKPITLKALKMKNTQTQNMKMTGVCSRVMFCVCDFMQWLNVHRTQASHAMCLLASKQRAISFCGLNPNRCLSQYPAVLVRSHMAFLYLFGSLLTMFDCLKFFFFLLFLKEKLEHPPPLQRAFEMKPFGQHLQRTRTFFSSRPPHSPSLSLYPSFRQRESGLDGTEESWVAMFSVRP